MIVMRRMTFPRSLSLSLALGTALAAIPVALPLLSAPPALAQSAPAAAVTGPVSALYAGLGQIQARNSGSFAQRAQILGPVVDRVYDLEAVLRASVGLRYAGFSDADKQQLRDVFRQFTVARYVSSFKPGGDARFTIDPTPRPSPVGSDQIVTTHIGSAEDAEGTEIDYVMRSGPQGWRIVDVLLNAHISQVAAQRSDFSATLSSGNVQNLIALLQKKVRAFSED
ncbi:toluene transporter [Gluconacetobacter aggeris]|uniref:Toluene transporter n=1 Tax=Gluconacetobacter aggeris TaxID=1286186 RepID=A0A7W4IW48_9PROT|nr:toluene transporter [Gluconacetobacter aggeris]